MVFPSTLRGKDIKLPTALSEGGENYSIELEAPYKCLVDTSDPGAYFETGGFSDTIYDASFYRFLSHLLLLVQGSRS